MADFGLMRRRVVLGGAAGLGFVGWTGLGLGQDVPWRDPDPGLAEMIAAGEAQVGVTQVYDPAYVALDYPMGDVPRDRGVCTDVVIRALRDGLGLDLQQLIHRDMAAHFADYPPLWGLSRPDRNIDHRRVPNMARYLERMGAALPLSQVAGDYLPGDIVASVFPDGQTHVVIVTARANAAGDRPLILHNVGAGARIEDRLFDWRITGWFRLSAGVRGRMAA